MTETLLFPAHKVTESIGYVLCILRHPEHAREAVNGTVSELDFGHTILTALRHDYVTAFFRHCRYAAARRLDCSIDFASSLRDAPSASRDFMSRSIETLASPVSILATRD